MGSGQACPLPAREILMNDKHAKPVSDAEAERIGLATGQPPSQVQGEAAAEAQSEQEKAEIASRMPGGANTTPSDPRGSADEKDAGGPAQTPAGKDRAKDARARDAAAKQDEHATGTGILGGTARD